MKAKGMYATVEVPAPPPQPIEPAAPRGPEDEWQVCVALVDALPNQALPQRVAAIGQLLRNPSTAIRQQALHLGSAVLADEQLVEHLRDGSDDVLRNAGLEILKLRGLRSLPVAVSLLADPDPDVVLQAILILDHLRDARAIEPLTAILASTDTNLVQAAITALGHIGNARVAGALVPFLHGDPWLQFAAVRAVGDLRATSTLPILERLIPDSFVGPVAVEAIGRIGGSGALQILHRQWAACVEHLGLDEVLALVAGAAETLPHIDRRVSGLVELLRPHLEDADPRRAADAARALLALGPGESDAAALDALIAGTDSTTLPRCLRSRKDLLNRCLTDARIPRSWSFEMLGLWPLAAQPDAIDAVLRRVETQDVDDALAGTLVMLRSHDVGTALLSLYMRLPAEKRRLLLPALRNQRRSMMTLIGSCPLDAPTRVVLVAVLGQKKTFVHDLLSLPLEERLQVLFEIADQRRLMSLVPWKRLAAEAPEAYAPVVARVAGETRLISLRPVLRTLLDREPLPAVIRTIGLLADEASVPLLIRHLPDADPLVEAYLVEALGRIGGDASREALRGLLGTVAGDRRRNAMKALAGCAVAEDMELFRQVVTDPDWVVRLACVDALSRFPSDENLVAMASLVADPMAIVAQRAARSRWRSPG